MAHKMHKSNVGKEHDVLEYISAKRMNTFWFYGRSNHSVRNEHEYIYQCIPIQYMRVANAWMKDIWVISDYLSRSKKFFFGKMRCNFSPRLKFHIELPAPVSSIFFHHFHFHVSFSHKRENHQFLNENLNRWAQKYVIFFSLSIYAMKVNMNRKISNRKSTRLTKINDRFEFVGFIMALIYKKVTDLHLNVWLKIIPKQKLNIIKTFKWFIGPLL